MKIVFFTGADFHCDELSRYIISKVLEHHGDVYIVAVQSKANRNSWWISLRRKFVKIGFFATLEVISGLPIQIYLAKKDQAEINRMISRLPRSERILDQHRISTVLSINGIETEALLRKIDPDIIIQSGAGILRKNIFSSARICTLNMHHGIAPLIKGMNSIYWALWCNKPEWIGATIHKIDDGIDTGDVLAYAPVQSEGRKDGFPSLFLRSTEEGVKQLLIVISRINLGERWHVTPPSGKHVYRSTFSGWKRILLLIRNLFI